MRHAVRPLKELYSRDPASDFSPLELKAVRERFIKAGLCRSYVNDSVRRIVRVSVSSTNGRAAMAEVRRA